MCYNSANDCNCAGSILQIYYTPNSDIWRVSAILRKQPPSHSRRTPCTSLSILETASRRMVWLSYWLTISRTLWAGSYSWLKWRLGSKPLLTHTSALSKDASQFHHQRTAAIGTHKGHITNTASCGIGGCDVRVKGNIHTGLPAACMESQAAVSIRRLLSTCIITNLFYSGLM